MTMSSVRITPRTENCRHTTSLKYRLPLGQFRVAGLWQFGGYGQNNASNGAYQVGVGGDIPHLANGVLSFDAIYSWVKDSVSTAVLGGRTDANGNPIPAVPTGRAHGDDLRQYGRDAAGQIHEWTPEVVCGLRRRARWASSTSVRSPNPSFFQPSRGIVGDPIECVGLSLEASDVFLLSIRVGAHHMPLRPKLDGLGSERDFARGFGHSANMRPIPEVCQPRSRPLWPDLNFAVAGFDN